MEYNFAGKKALVSGAGRGIGREIVRKLVQYGAQVVGISRTQESCDSLVKEFPDVTAVALDIADWEKTKAVLKTLGTFDFLVNNAGIECEEQLGEVTESALHRIFSVNYMSAVNICQEVAKTMKDNGKPGAIVNISSNAAKRVFPGFSTYCASKAAMDHLTRSMALEFGPFNIRTNTVGPTGVDTDMLRKYENRIKDNPEGYDLVELIKYKIPLKRLCKVEEIAYPTMFLLSHQASMVNGLILDVDGGSLVQL